jgi:hypothetical protein
MRAIATASFAGGLRFVIIITSGCLPMPSSHASRDASIGSCPDFAQPTAFSCRRALLGPRPDTGIGLPPDATATA